MKKVLFLFAGDVVRKKLADPKALAELMNDASLRLDAGLEIKTALVKDLSFVISNGFSKIRDHRNKIDLEDYDFVYLRKAGSAMQQMLTVALYLEDHSVPFYDREIARASSRNKLSQMYILKQRGVPIPTTLFCRNRKRTLRLVSETYADLFTFPVIAKATGGTRGDANYLVHTADDLAEILKTEKRHFLIQEFIPNDGDWRYFVAGGILRGVIGRKAAEGTHLNNTSKGGQAALIDLSEVRRDVRDDVLKAALVLGRDVAGVDVIFNKLTGAYAILEVNRAPQIEHASYEQEKAEWLVKTIQRDIVSYQPAPLSGTADGQLVFGRFETVWLQNGDLDDGEVRVVAKVDTGADSSSVHAESIREHDGVLYATIARMPVVFTSFDTVNVKSSNGHVQRRYSVIMRIRIAEKTYRVRVTLADRASMGNEALIGRRFLKSHHILVDVGKRFIMDNRVVEKTSTNITTESQL